MPGLWLEHGRRRMKNLTSHLIKAHTFIGNGNTGTVLVIEPTFEPVDETFGTSYEMDALVLLDVLADIYCAKTLAELKKHL